MKTFKLNQFYFRGDTGRDNLVGIANTLRFGIRLPIEESFPDPSRPTLGPTQPSVQWIPNNFPRGKAAGA